MKTGMQRLQADLVKSWPKNWQYGKDIRRCRWLSPDMRAQRQLVISAVGASSGIGQRMMRCGEVDEHDNMWLCKVPLCPRCMMNRRRTETKGAINKVFAEVPNEQLAMLTLLMPVAQRLGDVSEIIRAAELRVRNFLIRSRIKDPRWNGVHLLGYWELDRMRGGDIPTMGRNTRLFLEQTGMPVVAYEDVTLWLPHFHGIVALGEISAEEFATALRGYGYSAAYQVDLQLFDVNRPVQMNIRDVVRYANKFRIEEDYKASAGNDNGADRDGLEDRQWWSQEDIRDYAEWLCEDQKGFQSMRFRMKAKEPADVVKVLRIRESVDVRSQDVIGADCSGRGMSGGVSVGGRYKNVILDTNWLVRPPHLRRGIANDGWKFVDDLFDYGGGRDQADDGFVRYGEASVEEKPMHREVTGETLRAIFDRARQRCA